MLDMRFFIFLGLTDLKVDLPSQKSASSVRRRFKTQLHCSSICVWAWPRFDHIALYPVFHQQLQKKLLCPIVLLVQACRHFRVCWELTAMKDSFWSCLFTPAPPMDITIAVTILAQMSLCHVPVTLSPARQVPNPTHGQAQLQCHRVGDRWHLEGQSCFQPRPPSRAAVHRSVPGGNTSQQSCVE